MKFSIETAELETMTAEEISAFAEERVTWRERRLAFALSDTALAQAVAAESLDSPDECADYFQAYLIITDIVRARVVGETPLFNTVH